MKKYLKKYDGKKIPSKIFDVLKKMTSSLATPPQSYNVTELNTLA